MNGYRLMLLLTLTAASLITSVSTAPASEPEVKRELLEFALPDLQGEIVTSSDERLRDKVVLVTLWGTWCKPCRTEIPTFNDLQERYRDGGLVVLGIAFERDTTAAKRAEVLRTFSEEHKIEYLILDGGATTDFSDALPMVDNVGGLPVEIIVNRVGRVVACRNGYGYKKKWARDLERRINNLLAQEARVPEFDLKLCVNAGGTATPLWTEGIAVAIGWDAARAFERESHPLTPGGSAWFDVAGQALPGLSERAVEMASWFALEAFDATIAAGNRGSSDGFGWVPDHIGINVEAFEQTYGPPDDGALDRMTRILAHEYIHLLTYAFYPDHLEQRDTPVNRALWTMFFEGIGDYISVSKRWYPDEDGTYSSVAAQTLQRLEPIFVERLEAYATASPEEEKELRRGIAMGRFDEKWGSLPVALWLLSEVAARGEREVMEEMIRLGRDGVLPLALRHAAPELRPRIRTLASAREHQEKP